MTQKIRKAVFPVAGLGTRFLPATKASPKEMLPVVDKPLIQYAVEEAIAAGIEEIIFVTSGAKRSIEDHFDRNYELETKLAQAGRYEILEKVHHILPAHVTCVYTRQHETLGLGHAVLCAKELVGQEPFAVLLADDLIQAEPQNCLQQMMDVYAKDEQVSGVLAVQTVRPSETDQYGIVSIDESRIIHQIVEKPSADAAPSNLAVVGRYLLPWQIFEYLEQTQKGAGNEIQLTDAISIMLSKHPLAAHAFAGQRFDCGSKLGYLQANLEYAITHPEFGPWCERYLKKRFAMNSANQAE